MAAIGPDPIEQLFQAPPIVVPASKEPTIAKPDVPAREVEQTIEMPVASTPAKQEVPARQAIAGR